MLKKLEKASEGGEVETTGGYFYHPGRKFFPFVAIEFLSQITNMRTRIRNVRTYIYIYIYENLDLDDQGGFSLRSTDYNRKTILIVNEKRRCRDG